MSEISDKLFGDSGLKSIEELVRPGLKCKVNVQGIVYDGTIEEVTETAIILAEHCVSAALCKILVKSHISAIEFRQDYQNKIPTIDMNGDQFNV